MLSLLIRFAANAVGLLTIAAFSNGEIEIKGVTGAIIAAIVLGVVNAVIKPILLFIAKTMTCVLSCLTLGLWSLVLTLLINTFLFYAVGQGMETFHVKSIGAAFWGALALSIINALASALTPGKDEKAGR